MKRFLIIMVLVCGSAAAQTTTYTGTIKDLSLNVVTSGQVTFTLAPPVDTSIPGTGRFTPSTVNCNINVDGSLSGYVAGVVSGACVVASNTTISPSGTAYRICIQPNYIAPGSCFYDYAVTSSKDIATVIPTLSTGPTNYATGQVQLLPSGGQVISQPTGTTLGINSLNGVLYANAFPGTSVAAQINAAIAACGSGSCVVQIPPTMGPGEFTYPLPQNVTVFDYRKNGVDIYSNTTNNPAGTGCGIGIYINTPSFPPINPGAANCVGVYSEVDSDASLSDLWGFNPLVYVRPNAIVNAIGGEVDINNDGVDIADTYSGTKGKTIGIVVASGSTLPITTGYFLTANSGSGGIHHGLVLDGVIDDGISFRPALNTLTIVPAVTGSASPQTVVVSSFSNLYTGKTYAIDQGASQENVTLTAVNVRASTITGIFLKSHTANMPAYEYTAAKGMSFDHTIFSTGTVFLVANLQDYSNSHNPQLPAFAIKDTSGVQRNNLSWDLSNKTHVSDLGGGIEFDTDASVPTLKIDPNGNALVPTIVSTVALRKPPATDLNTLVNCGYYDANNVVNGPTAFGTNYIKVQVVCSGDPTASFLTQIAYDMTGGTNASYIRNKTSGTWGAWQLTAPPGTPFPVAASLTTTAATSDAVAIAGMTSSGHCSAPAATNSSAAANVATTYISAKATNSVTVTHAATAGMTFDLTCTPY